jgi:hypothetical protein
MKLELNGKKLLIEAIIPKKIRQFELRIESSRNNLISRISTVSHLILIK